MHIVEFQTILNRTTFQLQTSKKHFETTIRNFNGTVLLTANIPTPSSIPAIKIRVKRHMHLVPKSVDAELVTNLAQGFIHTTNQNNMTGQAIYTKIRNQFNEVAFLFILSNLGLVILKIILVMIVVLRALSMKIWNSSFQFSILSYWEPDSQNYFFCSSCTFRSETMFGNWKPFKIYEKFILL